MFRKALTFSALAFLGAVAAAPAQALAPDDDLKNVAQAIAHGDYASAEARIAAQGMTGQSDPAMLINLGNAYAGMGRKSDAQLAYRAALNSDNPMELDMADGSVRSSQDVARDGLRLLGVDLASW